MQRFLSLVVCSLLLSSAMVQAEVKLSGQFIATKTCPAYQSLRRETNPDNATVIAGKRYTLLAKNNQTASHYLIKMEASPPQRWVALDCGTISTTATTPPNAPATPSSQAGYLLAVSWQPAFCEGLPNKTECKSQTPQRFDANHFTLHGLWPQPRSNVFCGVSARERQLDEAGSWGALANITLSQATRRALDEVMPGSASGLDRHEWVKHGTCYSPNDPERYFQDSLKVMQALNQSAVQQLFANNIGKTITAKQIQQAFDQAFGSGAGKKIKLVCKRDGQRRLLVEITIGLKGDLRQQSLAAAVAAAPESRDIGCSSGLVDPVGLQ